MQLWSLYSLTAFGALSTEFSQPAAESDEVSTVHTHTESQSPNTSRRIYSITKSLPLLQHKWHHLGTQPHLLRAPSSLLSRSDRSNKEPGLCNKEEESIAAKSFLEKLVFSWECDYGKKIKDCGKKWVEPILVEVSICDLS